MALWLDYVSKQAKMSQSLANGDISQWTAPETAFSATYNFLGGSYNPTLTDGIRAVSALSAKFNRPLNRPCMVWHEAEQPNVAKTDVYYTCKTTGGWLPKVLINDVTVNDQFMPSLAGC